MMAFKFFSAFLLGLYNSFNVFNLSCLIVILILNDFWVVHKGSRSKFFIYALFFVLWVRSSSYTIGIWDRFLAQDDFVLVVKVMNLALAGIFFVLGVLNFREWVIFKKSKDCSQFKVWPLLTNQMGKKIFGRIIFFLLAFLIGNVLAFLNILWPQDAYLYDISREPMMGRNWVTVFGIFLFYGLGVLTPSVVLSEVWVKVNIARWTNFASIVKVSFSAIFFAVSLGLIFVIYRI